MIKSLIFMVTIAEVFTLTCYICENFETASCLNVEDHKDKLLKQCERNETRCALLVERITDLSLVRKCVTDKWQCDSTIYNCDFCSTDGCNTENDIKPPIQDVVTVDLLKSNMYGIAVIGLVITMLIIWCVIKLCHKKDDFEYAEEDDCDEYYENETNIDLE